jgi:hypothetical protein
MHVCDPRLHAGTELFLSLILRFGNRDLSCRSDFRPIDAALNRSLTIILKVLRLVVAVAYSLALFFQIGSADETFAGNEQGGSHFGAARSLPQEVLEVNYKIRCTDDLACSGSCAISFDPMLRMPVVSGKSASAIMASVLIQQMKSARLQNLTTSTHDQSQIATLPCFSTIPKEIDGITILLRPKVKLNEQFEFSTEPRVWKSGIRVIVPFYTLDRKRLDISLAKAKDGNDTILANPSGVPNGEFEILFVPEQSVSFYDVRVTTGTGLYTLDRSFQSFVHKESVRTVKSPKENVYDPVEFHLTWRRIGQTGE